MKNSDTAGNQKMLDAIQAEFHQQLPPAIADIERQWAKLCRHEVAAEELAKLHLLVHGLTGSSGTFGARTVSMIAGEIEAILKHQLSGNSNIDAAVKQKMDRLIMQLAQAAQHWQPSATAFAEPISGSHASANNGELICMIEADLLLAGEIFDCLEQAGYRVRHYARPEDFEACLEKLQPDAVLIGMQFDGSDMDGVMTANVLIDRGHNCPVIFISEQTGIEARLAALRAGASRYFIRPLERVKLLQALDDLFSHQPEAPYRIMLIDDDEVLLDYYATVLRKANMVVETLNDPLQCIDRMQFFQPDLLLLDVYMPACSGLELAQLIRQDDTWAQLPIVFLSTEPDLDQQLLALDLGADDFFNKSVEPQHLLKAIFTRAQRSRRFSATHKELQSALRESEFRNITLDQHAIVSIADVEGRITFANDKFCEMSLYSREELLGQNHRILKSGRHPPEFYQQMWSTIGRGKIWHGLLCNLNKEGEEYWVESTIVPFLDEHGRPYQYVAARTDVTRLHVSEERLNRSQAFANIGTWDWNIKTGELYWSERIAPLFGYEQGEIEHSYDNFLNAVHPDDRQYVIDSVNDCIEHGARYDIEHRVVWQNGEVHWLQERGDVVRGGSGEPLHMLGVVQDITTRKQAENALQESEQRLKVAQQIGKIGNWSLDVASGKIYWSDEIYHIFGYQLGEFEPNYERFMAAVHPDDVALIEQFQQTAEKKGEKHSVDHRIILPDGRIRWVHEEAETIKNEAGEMVALQGTVQNISDRIWSEQLQKGNGYILELIAKDRPLEEILTAIVLHAEQMLPGVLGSIMLLDESGYSLHCGAAPSLPGFYNEAIDGIEIGPNMGSCCAAAYNGRPLIAADLSSHPNWKDYRELTRKAGLAACWSMPIIASSGRVLGTCDIYYRKIKVPDENALDLVARLASLAAIAIEQKRARETLVEALQEAENANNIKSQFLSSMSHELRTPMNAIIGFAQLLQMDADQLTEMQLDNVSEIVQAGEHLLKLINEILDLAKIESGRIDLYMENVSVAEVMEECLSLLAPLVDSRGIEITLLCHGKQVTAEETCHKDLQVHADRTRLKQVLFNLLSNAVKYNVDNGKIIVACTEPDAAQIRISIQDTGPGIAPEKQSQLFKGFNRLGIENSNIEGTGIGLLISKNIMELMHGCIGVDSRPGEGATFWIELPRGEVDENDQHPDSREDDETPVRLDEDEHVYTLLYVEDCPANLRLVMQLLAERRPNIKIWSAYESMQGLELAVKHQPDLILLDINLQGMNGYEILQHLRSREDTREIPVVAISANAMPADITRGFEAGFDRYITKPLDVMAFLSVIDEILLPASVAVD